MSTGKCGRERERFHFQRWSRLLPNALGSRRRVGLLAFVWSRVLASSPPGKAGMSGTIREIWSTDIVEQKRSAPSLKTQKKEHT